MSNSIIFILILWSVLGFYIFTRIIKDQDDGTANKNIRAFIFAFICGPFVWIVVCVIHIYPYVTFIILDKIRLKMDLWIRKGRNLIISDEEIKCSKCGGSGQVIGFYEFDKKWKLGICPKCHGEGKLDWIRNARGE